MDKDYKVKLISYRQTMSVTKAMLERGIITAEEYNKIDKIMTNKYGINSSTIFR